MIVIWWNCLKYRNLLFSSWFPFLQDALWLCFTTGKRAFRWSWERLSQFMLCSNRFVFPPLFSLLIGSFTPATNCTDGLVCFTFARISSLCSEMLTRRFSRSTCTGFCCAAFRECWDINHGQHSAEWFQLTCEISEGSSCVCSAAETTENKVLNCCGF